MHVIIMQGISGSGKSSYALDNHPGAWFCSADRFFLNLTDGQYKFDPSLLGEAHADCFKSFIQAMQKGRRLIVVDNTNTTAHEVSPYILGAEAFGYKAEIVCLMVEDPSVAAARNSHGVSLKTVIAQHARLLEFQGMPWWNRRVQWEWSNKANIDEDDGA